MHKLFGLFAIALIGSGFPCVLFSGEVPALNVAQFDERGRLLVPENFEEWIFLGSSLGMGYSQSDFDPDSPGMFQVVRMEPLAWQAFVETGKFLDGSMIALHFYGSESKVSINRSGYVMDDLHFAEIHLKDSTRFPDGFNFFNIENGQAVATAMDVPNECISCHTKDGAYDGVFVQFYPVIQPHLPDEVQRRLAGSAGEPAH